MKFQILSIFCALAAFTEGYKILVVVPMNGKSHMNYMQVFNRELISRGHEVWCITNIPMSGTKPNNYTEVLIDPPFDFEVLAKKSQIYKGTWMPTILTSTFLPIFGYLSADHGLRSESVQNLMQRNDLHFDLVIYEDVIYHDSFLIFGHRFQAPVVSICPLGIMEIFDQDMGLITPSSHVSHTLLTYTDNMSFVQRWHNTMLTLYDWFLRQIAGNPLQNSILRNHFGYLEPLPSISDMRKNISLTFVNSHRSITLPRPSMPGLIYIGGAHIKPPKPLPVDLQQFLEEAKHGVIYFSFGTLVSASEMPKEKLNAFLDTFRKLKQMVIWKFEDESLPNLPDNVLIRKWLPQTDILAHPNVVLFISHGGMFSNFEAINYGIQLLMIPFAGDQHRNALGVENAGYGKFMDFTSITTESLLNVLNEMLTDNKYSNKVKEISAIFKDNVIHPMDEFIWWVEHVIKFRGAKYLKSHAIELSIFTYLLLDVWLVNLIVVAATIFVFYLSIKNCLCKKRSFDGKRKQQ